SNFYGHRDSGLQITKIRKVGDEMVFTVEMTGNDASTFKLSPSDVLYTGSFTGDGKDELLVFNGHQLALVDDSQNQFHVIWQANDWLGDWHFGTGDRLTVGDFNGDGRPDVFIQSNTGWAGLFLCYGQSFSEVWMSGDPAKNENWIGDW